ncbi:MAG TPA: PKD domain-containing protein [Solirubrobacteraceae bacterium]|nr:PKD domain-containing protein [Solirubrobacteraceae bacterium]
MLQLVPPSEEPIPPSKEVPPGKESTKEPTKAPAKEPTKEPPGKKTPPVETNGTLIGSTTVQPHVDTDTAGSAEAFQYKASVAGTINSLALYVPEASTASSIVVGLYSGVAGHPATLLTSATIEEPTANAWNSIEVPPVTVSAGSEYWLAALAPSGKLAVTDIESGGKPTQESRSHSLEELPSSWGSGVSYDNSPASFYASGVTVSKAPEEPKTPEEPKAPAEEPKEPEEPKTPEEPVANFNYSPSSTTVGQVVTFDGASSTCPGGPCTYEWSNDDGPNQPIPPQTPLGNGKSISLTFSTAGTQYIRLLVTNVLGQSATVEHNVTVAPEPPPPPPPTAPSNTTAPTINGTAEVGQTLSATTGSWAGSTPISYSYQWQQDDTTNIAGATSSSYEPVASDAGHTLDVVVTASNSAGKASATSAQTAAVAKEISVGGQQTNCIKVPSACGYPDATNTGVPASTALKSESQNIAVNKAGTTIKDIALDAEISVEANNTTIEDSEITVEGTQTCGKSCGGRGIWIKPGVTGTVIKNVTCHGAAATGVNVTQYCIMSNDSDTTIERLHAYYCTECLAGAMDLSESFIDETGAVIPEEHYEDIYYGGGAGPLIVNHNTMLNPNGQTAVVFASVDFGDQTTLTITNNLMAGGGYMIYGGGSGSGGKVVGPVTITGNRFSRKYYPEGGSYGVASYLENSVTSWSGNVWDETLKTVPMPGG